MFLEIGLTALGLSMDACAASIALSAQFRSWSKLIISAFLFAGFQALMPLLGYLLGLPFRGIIEPVDHWIAFFVLGFLGLNMIFDFAKDNEAEKPVRVMNYKLMFTLAFATSIDAFVVGIGFHALQWPLFESILIIGVVTLILSLLGILFGAFLQKSLMTFAEKMGGVILILLGVKILISHLFF